MYRLYDYLPSGNGYKARLVLRYLNLPYELIEVDIKAGESRTPEFLKKNAGLYVKDVLVLLDRQEGAKELLKERGYNLISILGLESMLNYLMAKELIAEKDYRASIDYISGRRAERTGD